MNSKFLFNKGDSAKVMGVSVQAFSKWNIEPVKKSGRETFFYLPDIIDYRLSRETDETLSLTKARTELAAQQADGHKMKNAVSRRELAPVELLTFALADMASQAISILDSLPLRLKKKCPKLTARDIEFLRKEIIKTQNIIADTKLSGYDSSKTYKLVEVEKNEISN